MVKISSGSCCDALKSVRFLMILAGASMLVGCASLTGPKEEIAEDGSRIYSLTSLYAGAAGSREQVVEWMDIDARNLCRSEYTLLSEESIPIIDPVGAATSSRLVWKIKCRPVAEEPAPQTGSIPSPAAGDQP